jgi:hypothetical protein
VAAAIALTVILAVLAVFQLALVFGAPLGHFAWGGRHRVLPSRLRIGSLVSIVIYAVIAMLALDRAGVIDVVTDTVSTVGMWIAFAYFVLGIPLNAISRSKPERYTMTPVVAVLAILSLLVALG